MFHANAMPAHGCPEQVFRALDCLISANAGKKSSHAFEIFEIPVSLSYRVVLDRLFAVGFASFANVVVAVIYIDRLIRSRHDFVLNSNNAGQVVLTAVALASKWMGDFVPTNKLMSGVAGLQPEDFNAMERCFISSISWNLYVQDEYAVHEMLLRPSQ